MGRRAAAAVAAQLIILCLLLQQCTPQAEATRRAAAARPTRRMVFYMHDVALPPNATAVVVTGQKGGVFTEFGETHVFDDKLTDRPDPRSLEIGRGQGLYSVTSLPASPVALLFVFTAVFQRPAFYNGSTLCLQGFDPAFLPEREIAVARGTGRLRRAQGYAILSTASINFNTGNAVIKFNVTLFL